MADVSSKLLGQFVESLEANVLSEEAGGSAPGGNGQAPAAAAAPPAATEAAAPAQPAPAAPSAPAEAAPDQGVRKIEHPDAEPVDLVKTAGGAVSKRLVPTLAVVAVILAIIFWRRSSK
jgi:hypothetical protein